jgi:hypothetical protein
MVCENCKINLDRQEQGYSPLDLKCTCTKTESLTWNLKQVIGLIFIVPIVLGVLIIMTPLILIERMGVWLESN